MENVVVVVTYSPKEDLFLLLKRADTRQYSPGKWEFPSGFLEKDDVKEEALRELKEETGLVGEAIRSGESFKVESDTDEKIIEIKPVLAVVDYQKPELSREHTGYRWLEMSEIEDLETVKGLEKDLQNVGVK